MTDIRVVATHGAVKQAMSWAMTTSSLASLLRSTATTAGESKPEVLGKFTGALNVPSPLPVSRERLVDRIVEGDDEIQSPVAVEVASREVLGRIWRRRYRVVNRLAERPGAIVQSDRGERQPRPRQIKASVAVEVCDDVSVSEEGIVRSW